MAQFVPAFTDGKAQFVGAFDYTSPIVQTNTPFLIHTSKSLNHGQRKPRQWGPLSAVQYAVRVNAERLGIDPKIIIPMWEGAGQPREYTQGKLIAQNNIGWNSEGISFNGTSSELNLGTISSISTYAAFIIDCKISPTKIQTIASVWKLEDYSFAIIANSFSSGDLCFYSHTGLFPYYRVTGLDYSKRNVLTLIFDGSMSSSERVTIFCNGVKLQATLTGSFPESLPIVDSDFYVGRQENDATRYLSGDIYSFQVHSGEIAQLNETTYALIMPVARPVFFDKIEKALAYWRFASITNLATADVNTDIKRDLQFTASQGITTSTLSILIAAVIEFLMSVSVSVGTSDLSTSIERDLTSSVTGEVSTSNISSSVKRDLRSAIDNILSTTGLNHNVVRQLTSTILQNISTRDMSSKVIRELTNFIAATISSSDVSISIAKLLEFLMNINTAFTTSNVSQNTNRQLKLDARTSVIASQPKAEVLRELSSNILQTFTFLEIEAFTTSFIQMVMNITCNMATSVVDHNVLRNFTSSIDQPLATNEVDVQVERELTQNVTSTITTSSVTSSVERFIKAVVDLNLTTSDLSLANIFSVMMNVNQPLSTSDTAVQVMRLFSENITSEITTEDAIINISRELINTTNVEIMLNVVNMLLEALAVFDNVSFKDMSDKYTYTDKTDVTTVKIIN